MLSSTGGTETEKFWKAFDFFKKEAKIVSDCLDDMRRSNFNIIITVMYNYGMLRDDDLKLFSESVQKYVSTFSAED